MAEGKDWRCAYRNGRQCKAYELLLNSKYYLLLEAVLAYDITDVTDVTTIFRRYEFAHMEQALQSNHKFPANITFITVLRYRNLYFDKFSFLKGSLLAQKSNRETDIQL